MCWQLAGPSGIDNATSTATSAAASSCPDRDPRAWSPAPTDVRRRPTVSPRNRPLFACLVAGTLLSAVSAPAADVTKPDPAQVEFFEKSVRPVLATKCFGCHGPEKQKGGLRLDSRSSMMQGGDTGPAISPGDPKQSRLVEAIRYGSDLQMPPKGKLKDTEIHALTEWVKGGAYWPEPGRDAPRPAVAAPSTITDQDRAFWSFQPVRNPAIPAVSDSPRARPPHER